MSDESSRTPIDDFQENVLAGAERDGLALTPTGRLSRALRNRYRLQRMAEGKSAWQRPNIKTLNQWVRQVWQDSWPETTIAPESFRLARWFDLMDRTGPPGGLARSPALAGLLDEAYGLLIRHNLDPIHDPDDGSPLVAWRREISRQFFDDLQRAGLFHPDEVMARVAGLIAGGRINPPERITWAGFEIVSPAQDLVLSVFRGKCRVNEVKLPRRAIDTARAVSLADRRQEVAWLAREVVLAAQEGPLSRIGIVLPDVETYLEPLRRALDEVVGENPDNAAFTNVALADRLGAMPFVKAALMPVDLALGPVTRQNMLDLIQSPYFGLWRGHRRDLTTADRVWRESVETRTPGDYLDALERAAPRLAELLKMPDGRRLDEALSPLNGSGRKPAQEWAARLQRVLGDLQFPVCGDEVDHLSHRHWRHLLADFERDFAGNLLTGSQFGSWLRRLIDNERTTVAGSEQAGVQVLGLVEAQGLSFDHLFIVGMSAASFPWPVRALPLLSPAERSKVRGGTAKMEYEFAETSVTVLLAGARQVTLTRPLHSESEPLPASPLWPASEISEEFGLWHGADRAWLRAPWYNQAWRGLLSPHELPADDAAPGVMPASLSVTGLDGATPCAFRFLVRLILRLDELPEPVRGISPKRRGISLHQVLARFCKEVRENELDLGGEDAKEFLAESVDRELESRASDVSWRIERQRWLGKPGLLWAWLEDERERWAEGWRFWGEEIEFEGELIDGAEVEIRGRIDRIDWHPDLGAVVFDYKTGRPPNKGDVDYYLTRPQLPLYLEGLLRGLIEPDDDQSRPRLGPQVRADYIGLRSAGGIDRPLQKIDAGKWSEILREWRAALARFFGDMQRGRFEPLWRDPPLPMNIGKVRQECQGCSYHALCGSPLFRLGEAP